MFQHWPRRQGRVTGAAVRIILHWKMQTRMECATVDQKGGATRRRSKRDPMSIAAQQRCQCTDDDRFPAASWSVQQHTRGFEIARAHLESIVKWPFIGCSKRKHVRATPWVGMQLHCENVGSPIHTRTKHIVRSQELKHHVGTCLLFAEMTWRSSARSC